MTQIIGKQIYFVLPHSPCSHWNTLSLSLSPHLSLSLSLSLSHSLQGYTLLFILWFPKNLNRFPFPIFELLKLRQFLHRSEVFSDLVVAKSFSEREKWVRSSTPTSTSMTLTSIGNHHFLLSLLYFNENLFLVRVCVCFSNLWSSVQSCGAASWSGQIASQESSSLWSKQFRVSIISVFYYLFIFFNYSKRFVLICFVALIIK